MSLEELNEDQVLNDPNPEMISDEQVAEIVAEDDGAEAPMSEDEDMEDIDRMEDDEEENDEDHENGGYDKNGNIEIDLRNNSCSYFDEHKDSIYMISTHPKLPLVMTGGGDNTAYIWTCHSHPPKMVAELEGSTESVVAGGFSPDGAYAVTGDMTGTITAWKAIKRGEAWKAHGKVSEVDEVIWIKFHPKQAHIFALGAADGSVWVYSLAPELENITVLYSHSLPCTNGEWVDVDDMDSLTLMTCSEDGTIVNWNVYTGASNWRLGRKELRGEKPWVNMKLSPSGGTIAVGGSEGSLALIGVATGTTLDVIKTGNSSDLLDNSIEALAFSNSETLPLLAVGNVSGQVYLYDAKSWKIRRTFDINSITDNKDEREIEVGETAVTQLLFDGPLDLDLYCSSMDGVIRRWDVRNGAITWEGHGHNSGILGFALAPTLTGGKRLVSAGDEGVSLVFELE
ncbi:essential protein [Nadsonia fulvescens var. elongata DSM 6958]|uniref:Essential protein n=1 Tax=Nadsonia fulvescens var. elongata DSM 6958 TaxID=857566 RepID=A0A1E3PU26_9ASCO|nr:essential protein [Nadsonia fulvescens var. elongata DSM 6958]